MPSKHPLLLHLGALGIALLGTVGVVGISLGMNASVEGRATEVATVVEMAMAPASAKPPTAQKRQRSSPVKKAARAAPSAAAPLAAGLAGLDFGLEGGADAAMMAASNALSSEMGARVMDEDSVAEPPRPTERVPPDYPARARASGQTGAVTVSFIVDVDGSAVDTHVVEAIPPGVFEDAALAAVAQWQFEPGRHEGAPVAVRVRQTLRFELE